MTRIVNGIYDDLVMDTGFFISDQETDILCDWLESYASALERAWERSGSEGNPRTAKHAKVRSFIKAVTRKRKGEAEPAKSKLATPPKDGKEKK